MGYAQSHKVAADGRAIEVATFGDPRGHTVFFHHGSPGCVETARTFEAVAEDAGLFFVTMSRAGYGTSARRAGRTVASIVDDTRSVLDAFDRDEYVSVGWSGGGPHALACAALDAPRCRKAWSLAGVAPTDVDFDWTEGMGPENVEEFELAKVAGPDYEGHVEQYAAQFVDATADNIIEIFGGLLSDVDKAVLADAERRAAFALSCRHAFASGWRGFYDDDRAFFANWGFDPTAITVPVEVWYGDNDLMVPATHGAWLGANLPTSSVVYEPGEGHISLVVEHLDELASSFVRAFD